MSLERPGRGRSPHRGVLFLDELPLFRADVLETLRAPLEDGVATIVRSGGCVTFPCRFSLIGAMNPCRCGFLGDRRRQCRCSPRDLEIYRNKLSGPLLDRFDMQVEMPRLTKRELLGEPDGECSQSVRARVVAARALQAERYGSSSVTNASAPKARIEKLSALSSDARECLSAAVENGLSGRGLDRTLRVARTMADLRGDESVTVVDIAQALSYRRIDGYGVTA